MTCAFSKEKAAIFAARKVEFVVFHFALWLSVLIFLLSADIQSALGKIAGFIIFLAGVPYIIAIFRGETTPNRTTWWIWTVLSVLMVSSYHESGANNTIWIPLVYVLDQGLVALISLHPKYGEGGKNKFDITCTIGAVAGIVLWRIAGPVPALMLFIASDALAALPTAKKAYRRPQSEDLFAWIMTFVGNVINIFAAEKLTIEILSYPAYAAIMSGVILLPLIINNKRKKAP